MILKKQTLISVRGIDTDYLFTSGYEVKQGRSFSENDIYSGRNLALIGSELANVYLKEVKIHFKKEFSIGNGKYKVIGVLAEKGSGLAEAAIWLALFRILTHEVIFQGPI